MNVDQNLHPDIQKAQSPELKSHSHQNKQTKNEKITSNEEGFAQQREKLRVK
jgi:hypothetical protein